MHQNPLQYIFYPNTPCDVAATFLFHSCFILHFHKFCSHLRRTKSKWFFHQEDIIVALIIVVIGSFLCRNLLQLVWQRASIPAPSRNFQRDFFFFYKINVGAWDSAWFIYFPFVPFFPHGAIGGEILPKGIRNLC